jgi:hypothetical protein
VEQFREGAEKNETRWKVLSYLAEKIILGFSKTWNGFMPRRCRIIPN